LNWERRGAKLLASFFNGYGGGFTVALPTNFILAPETIQWIWVFTLPFLSGLAMTWPQVAKMFQEFAMEQEGE